MDEHRIDWITQQYVWAIQNDSKYHNLLRKAAQDKAFSRFRRTCGSAITNIRAMLRQDGQDDDFAEVDRYLTVLTLWVGHGGEQLHGDPDFDFYCKRLRQAGVSYPSGPNEVTEQPTIIETVQMDTPEINTMAKLFETKQFIGGIEASQQSEAQLIATIKATEDQIADLKKIKTASKKIEANIAAMEADLASVVAVLDAR